MYINDTLQLSDKDWHLQHIIFQSVTSVQRYPTIMDGVTYDFAFLHYQSLMSITRTFRSLIGSKSRTFDSCYAKNESALQTSLDNLIEIYKELE